MFTYPINHFKPSPPKAEFLHASNQLLNSSSYTWSSVNFGTASSDRRIVCCLHGYRLAVTNISSVTIGGVAATVHQTYNPQLCQVYTFSAIVPSNTSGNIVINFDQVQYTCSVAVYSIKGLTSTTPTVTEQYIGTSGTPSITLSSVAANTVLIGHLLSYSAGSGATTWSNLTEYSDLNGTNVNHSSAMKVFTAPASSYTITATPTAGVNERRMQIIGFK